MDDATDWSQKGVQAVIDTAESRDDGNIVVQATVAFVNNQKFELDQVLFGENNQLVNSMFATESQPKIVRGRGASVPAHVDHRRGKRGRRPGATGSKKRARELQGHDD